MRSDWQARIISNSCDSIRVRSFASISVFSLVQRFFARLGPESTKRVTQLDLRKFVQYLVRIARMIVRIVQPSFELLGVWGSVGAVTGHKSVILKASQQPFS